MAISKPYACRRWSDSPAAPLPAVGGLRVAAASLGDCWAGSLQLTSHALYDCLEARDRSKLNCLACCCAAWLLTQRGGRFEGPQTWPSNSVAPAQQPAISARLVDAGLAT